MPYFVIRNITPTCLYWNNWNNGYWNNQNFGYWQNCNGSSGANNRYLFSYSLSSSQSQLLNYSGNIPVITGYQIFSGVTGDLGTVYTVDITDFDPSYPDFTFLSSNTNVSTIPTLGNFTTYINSGNFTLTINNQGVSQTTDILTNVQTNYGYNLFSGFIPGSLGNSIQTSFLSGVSGKDPNSAKPIFSVFNDSTSTYVRNTGCWAYDYDLTPAPIYCDMGGASYGALVTPRHLICCWHAAIPSGATLRWVTKNNVVLERTVKGRAFMTGASLSADLVVCALDSDLPTGTTGINFCRVLPDNFINYLNPKSNQTYLPIIQLDKEYKALIKQVFSTGVNTFYISSLPSFTGFYESAIGGDSGSPSMMVISGTPILLTVDTFAIGGNGTSVLQNKFQLNWMVAQADLASSGGYSNYTLTDISLNGFLNS